MSDPRSQTSTTAAAAGQIAAAQWPAAALFGVRTRRILAVMLDLVAVSILCLAIWLTLLIVTFGLSLFFLPPLFPIVAFFYNGLTVSGPNMATPGMRACDLRVSMVETGAPVPFINAAAHAVLFYVSWMFPPILLFSLFASDKRCLHDIFSGVIVTRR